MFRGHGRRFAVVGACVTFAGLAVMLAFVTDGSDAGSADKSHGSRWGVYSPLLGFRVSHEKAKAARNSLPPNRNPRPNLAHQRQNHGPPGRPHDSVHPAKLIQNPQGFFSTSEIWPLTNEWIAAGRRTVTAVDAGATGRDDGVFGIFRQDFVRVRQTGDFVRIAGAGALKITKAPLGLAASTWAQRRGDIEFTSKNGVTGTLHLKTDTVTLNP